jgi:outer membrane protein TolC
MPCARCLRRVWMLPLVLALCGPRPAQAQAASRADTLRLSLGDAVTRALQVSEEIAVAHAQATQADAMVTQATAAALPQVGTGLTYNRAIRTIFDAAAAPEPADTTQIPLAYDEGRTPYQRYDTMSELLMQDFMSGLFEGLPFGRRNTYLAVLQVSQPLFAGGRITGQRRQAKHLQAAAADRLEETEADIVLSVRVAYLNTLLARRLQEVAVQSRRTAEDHLRQVEAFREAGTASEFDLLRARVDLANREPLVVQAENAARVAALELRRLVNLPAGQPLALTSRFSPDPVSVDQAALRRLMEDRALLRAAREVVASREAGVRVARGAWWPTLTLQGNLGFQAYPSTPLPPGVNAWRQDWNVALALSWVPFDGFGRSGRIAEAQAQLREARMQQALLEEALQVQYAAALGDFETAAANITARREAVSLAEETLELADLRYRNGLATQLEVSDAALQRDQALVNEIEALAAYVTAIAQLERLAGGRLTLLTEMEP